MLLEITHGRPAKREDREFIAAELAKVIKALALMSDSALGKMVANIFFNLKPPPYPPKCLPANRKHGSGSLNTYEEHGIGGRSLSGTH